MGFSNFMTFLRKRYPFLFEPFICCKTDHLCIDFSILLHKKFHELEKEVKRLAKTKKKVNKEAAISLLIEMLLKNLHNLIMSVKPKHSVYICFDGAINPCMKIIEQHIRHFKKVLDDSSPLKFNTEELFSDVSEFKEKLVDVLKSQWFSDKFDVEIIIDGPNIIGEGEVKIGSYIEQKVKESPLDHFVVFTYDSDCFLILNEIENVKLIFPFKGASSNYQLVRIPILKECLKAEFPTKTDYKRMIQDFKILLFHFSNDFLPSLEGMKLSFYLKLFFSVYSEMDGYLTNPDRKSIDWKNYAKLLDGVEKIKILLREKKEKILENKKEKEKEENEKEEVKNETIDKKEKEEEKEKEEVKSETNQKEVNMENEKEKDESNQTQKEIFEDDNSKKSEAANEINQKEEKEDKINTTPEVDKLMEEEVDILEFEEEENDNEEGEELEEEFEENDEEEENNYEEEDIEKINEHVKEYLKGIFWCFRYFSGETLSWEYCYKLMYLRTPRIRHIVKFLNDNSLDLKNLDFQFEKKFNLDDCKERRIFYLRNFFFTAPINVINQLPRKYFKKQFEKIHKLEKMEDERKTSFLKRLFRSINEIEFKDEHFDVMREKKRIRWDKLFFINPSLFSREKTKKKEIEENKKEGKFDLINCYEKFKELYENNSNLEFIKGNNKLRIEVKCDDDNSMEEEKYLRKLVLFQFPFPILCYVVKKEENKTFKEVFLEKNLDFLKEKYGIVIKNDFTENDKKKNVAVVQAYIVHSIEELMENGEKKIKIRRGEKLLPFLVMSKNMKIFDLEGNIDLKEDRSNVSIKNSVDYDAFFKEVYRDRIKPNKMSYRDHKQSIRLLIGYLIRKRLVEIEKISEEEGEEEKEEDEEKPKVLVEKKFGLGLIDGGKNSYNSNYLKFVGRSNFERFYYFSFMKKREMSKGIKNAGIKAKFRKLERRCDSLREFRFKKSCIILFNDFLKANWGYNKIQRKYFDLKISNKDYSSFLEKKRDQIEKIDSWIEKNVRGECNTRFISIEKGVKFDFVMEEEKEEIKKKDEELEKLEIKKIKSKYIKKKKEKKREKKKENKKTEEEETQKKEEGKKPTKKKNPSKSKKKNKKKNKKGKKGKGRKK